jgi:hypothetical protein
MTKFLGFDANICSRGINKGEERETEFLCMPHESQSFPIPANLNKTQ